MWVRRVVMMIMVVIMVMMVVMVVLRLKPAHTGAEGVAQAAIRYVRSRCMGTLPFHVVVMTFLNRTNFGLEPQHSDPILAQNACGRRHGPKGRMFAIFGTDMPVAAIFQRQHLFTIATDPAIGRRAVAVLFHDPFGKGFQHLRMVA